MNDPAQPTVEPHYTRLRVLLIMATLLLATMLASLDSSFMPLAFPDMIEDLDSNTADIVWVALGYLVTATGPMLLAARFADAFGHARLFQIGTVIYSLAMIACTWAPDVPVLITLRLIQGAGMALFLPTTFTIATRIYGADRRGRALGLLQAANAIGFILGPVFAGWLLDAYDWRATFASRIPLAMASIVLAIVALGVRQPLALPGASREFDYRGALFLTLALFGVLFGCTRLPVEDNHLDPLAWLIFASGFIFFALFLRHERRCTEPLIDLGLFTANPEFTRAAVAFAAMFASLPLTLFVLPIVLINGLEMLAWDVGMLMAASALCTTVMSPVSGWASDRFRPEFMSSTGALVRGIGYLLLLTVTAASGFWSLFWPLVIIGIGTGWFFSPNNALLLAHAPPERAAMVSGLFGTLRQAGYALGFAIIASLFTLIQKLFELNWAYAALERLPVGIADEVTQVFDAGGIWAPEMLILILRVSVLVCTAILGLSLLNSLPRLAMNWRRQLAAAGGLTAMALAGTYALAAIVPGGLAVTAAERALPAGDAAAPNQVTAFGWRARSPAVDIQPAVAETESAPFARYCAACHGSAGRGVPDLGVSLTESALVRSSGDAELLDFLRAGRTADHPDNRTGRPMPAFGWLPPETLAEIVRAVRELR
jgi:DHA2 family multidrug resistance protein-like MFS transporter